MAKLDAGDTLKRLRNRYRLVVMNDDTYEEVTNFRLSRMSVYVMLCTIFVLLVGLTVALIVFTPLKYYIPGYGNATAINFEAGLIFHLTDKLHVGFHTYNPASSRLGKNTREQLAFVYRSGIGYEVSEMAFVSAEVVKQQNQPVSINAGFQYNFQKNIFIRTGISTLTSNSYAAVALQLNFARIDVSASYHPQLGFTPGLLLLFKLNKEDKN